jgi:hypothetical protein
MSRTSSTGDADEALRDDDTAAKEYSPSSGRRVTDEAGQHSLAEAVRILTRGAKGEVGAPMSRSPR